MGEFLSEMRRLFDSEQYEEAFRLAEKAEQSGIVNSALLVWKSRSSMLSENPTVSLDEVESWLQQAIELDDEYLPAVLELGYFYLNVMDDPRRAMPLFERARHLATENATETLIGLAECISETDSPNAALELLEVENLVTDTSKLDELKTKLKTAVSGS